MRSLAARLNTQVLRREDYASLDPHGTLLTNLNTPEEYEAAVETAEKLRSPRR